MPGEDLERLAIPGHHHEIGVGVDGPLRFFERAATREMNRLRQLNDPLPRKVPKHLQAERVMMRPEVTKVAAAVNQNRAVADDRANRDLE